MNNLNHEMLVAIYGFAMFLGLFFSMLWANHTPTNKDLKSEEVKEVAPVETIDADNPLASIMHHFFWSSFPNVTWECTLQDSKGKLHELIIKIAFDFDDYSGGLDTENIKPYVSSYKAKDGSPISISKSEIKQLNTYLNEEYAETLRRINSDEDDMFCKPPHIAIQV